MPPTSPPCQHLTQSNGKQFHCAMRMLRSDMIVQANCRCGAPGDEECFEHVIDMQVGNQRSDFSVQNTHTGPLYATADST